MYEAITTGISWTAATTTIGTIVGGVLTLGVGFKTFRYAMRAVKAG